MSIKCKFVAACNNCELKFSRELSSEKAMTDALYFAGWHYDKYFDKGGSVLSGIVLMQEMVLCPTCKREENIEETLFEREIGERIQRVKNSA